MNLPVYNVKGTDKRKAEERSDRFAKRICKGAVNIMLKPSISEGALPHNIPVGSSAEIVRILNI